MKVFFSGWVFGKWEHISFGRQEPADLTRESPGRFLAEFPVNQVVVF